MKTIFAAAIMCVASSAFSEAGLSAGQLWNAKSPEEKYAYVYGYRDGVDRSLASLKDVCIYKNNLGIVPSCKKLLALVDIKLDQVIPGMDTIYTDYRNLGVSWAVALDAAASASSGLSEESVEAFLRANRK